VTLVSVITAIITAIAEILLQSGSNAF